MEEKQSPTWQNFQKIIKEIGEDNKNYSIAINANADDIGKVISSLCDEIYNLKKDVKFLSNEIMKMDHLQDDKKIMLLYRKYNE